MTKSSSLIWHYVVSVKSTVKISSIFVAFLENTNFSKVSFMFKWYIVLLVGKGKNKYLVKKFASNSDFEQKKCLIFFGQKFGNSDHSANVGFLRVSFFLVKGGVIKKRGSTVFIPLLLICTYLRCGSCLVSQKIPFQMSTMLNQGC